MIFGTLIVEREPWKWGEFLPLMFMWLQDVGIFALGAVLAVFLVRLVRRFSGTPGPAAEQRSRGWFDRLLLAALISGLICDTVGMVIGTRAGQVQITQHGPQGVRPTFHLTTAHWVSAWLGFVGGAIILTVLFLPFVIDLTRCRWRRIWALSRLSFKEAVRRKILWVFASLTLLFLFYAWFQDTKPEYQVRGYVTTIYFAMTPLLLLTASFLAAFGLPSDIQKQTIHTIVTKPVQRLEIILGRFLGYTGLMTFVLVGMTLFSLLYLVREIDPEAKRESVHARVPLYADILVFPGTREGRGESVGDEFEYRGYILGGPASKEYAVWHYRDVPARLAEQKEVPCEFSFSIFRTHKGKEGLGVLCTFTFMTWRYDPAQDAERQKARLDPHAQAEKYGIFEKSGVIVTNFHTLSIPVPGELFKNAREADPERTQKLRESGRGMPTPLIVRVKCDDQKQLIGAARHDLYFLEGDRPFALNFFKGAAGLWLRLCLVIGLAVACSTYLNGIISWVATWFLYLGGVFLPFIREVAAGVNFGGGPLQSALLLGMRVSPTTPPDTPFGRITVALDNVFRMFLARAMKAFPDVELYDLKEYVAQGFDIQLSQLLLDFVQVSVYLLPFALLAYYLLRSREVANPM
jgi:hypothetical protein